MTSEKWKICPKSFMTASSEGTRFRKVGLLKTKTLEEAVETRKRAPYLYLFLRILHNDSGKADVETRAAEVETASRINSGACSTRRRIPPKPPYPKIPQGTLEITPGNILRVRHPERSEGWELEIDQHDLFVNIRKQKSIREKIRKEWPLLDA